MQSGQRRLGIAQDAVDAVAQARPDPTRGEVDVGGLGLDGVVDQGVDEADDGRVAGAVAQALDVEADGLVGGGGQEGVVGQTFKPGIEVAGADEAERDFDNTRVSL